MNADADIQVWLSTEARVVTPYVQSSEAGRLRYEIQTVSTSHQGKSVLSQSNEIDVRANTPTALGNIAIRHAVENHCSIKIIIHAQSSTSSSPSQTYGFPCPY